MLKRFRLPAAVLGAALAIGGPSVAMAQRPLTPHERHELRERQEERREHMRRFYYGPPIYRYRYYDPWYDPFWDWPPY
jgi:hypothetical protein